MLNHTRSIQHMQHTFAEHLENPVESFGKTYSHQDPRRIWQISSVHCWSSTPAWLRCGGSLIICWCEGKPRRFQREWKIFSGWSVGYKSAEVTWNHHEHGRAISGSHILKYFNGYFKSVDLETSPQKKCLHQLSGYTDDVLIWISAQWGPASASYPCNWRALGRFQLLGFWRKFQLAALTSLATFLLSLKMC